MKLFLLRTHCIPCFSKLTFASLCLVLSHSIVSNLQSLDSSPSVPTPSIHSLCTVPYRPSSPFPPHPDIRVRTFGIIALLQNPTWNPTLHSPHNFLFHSFQSVVLR